MSRGGSVPALYLQRLAAQIVTYWRCCARLHCRSLGENKLSGPLPPQLFQKMPHLQSLLVSARMNQPPAGLASSLTHFLGPSRELAAWHLILAWL